MTSLLVFNHHALPFSSSEAADRAVPDFIRTCFMASRAGLSTILLDESVDRKWFSLELSEGYCWRNWYERNNNDSNRDMIRAFRSILTRQPLFDSCDFGCGVDLVEVKVDGVEYPALRAAVWNDSPLVSFPTRNPWNVSPVAVHVVKMDTDGELKETCADIVNFYSSVVFGRSRPGLVVEMDSLVNTGRELHGRMREYFPCLVLCGKANEQLRRWSASMTLFNQVKESFRALNDFCEHWRSGGDAVWSDSILRTFGLNHEVHGESETVRQNPLLRAEREFHLPTGEKKMFEKHIVLSSGYRIHFYVDDRT